MNTTPEITRWKTLAEGWIAAGERFEVMSRDVSRGHIERLAPRPGERLLDLACGAGDPAVALAASGAEVVACDAVPAMIDALRRRPEASELELVVSAGERLGFAPGSFDGLSCRFGVMFVDDPGHSLAEWRNALRPGGRAVLTVWGPLAFNPYFTLVGEALKELDDKIDAEAATTRGPFEWAEPGALAAALRAAGFDRVHEDLVELKLHLEGVRANDLLPLQLELSPTVRDRCAGLGQATLSELHRRVREAALQFETPVGLEIPACVLHLMGTRAAS